MTQLHILSSGSKANSYVLEHNGELLVIDQGLSFKQFSLRCNRLGCDPQRVKAILVTHEHSDHIAGIPLTTHRLGVPLFGTHDTCEIVSGKSKYPIARFSIEKQREFDVGQWKITAFPVHHDAVDPVGFSVKLPNGKRLVIATDTGRITTPILKHMNQASSIVLEANHEPSMLYANMKYPYELKQRIRSNNGHLSNNQTFDALSRITFSQLDNIIFGHLSEENNDPHLLQQQAENFLMEYRTVNFFIASQNNPFSVPL